MSGKGSGRRPGEGYASGWDAIFGKKVERVTCLKCPRDKNEQCDYCGPMQQDKKEDERK